MVRQAAALSGSSIGGEGRGGRVSVNVADGVTISSLTSHSMLRKYRGRSCAFGRAGVRTVGGRVAVGTDVLVMTGVGRSMVLALVETAARFGGGEGPRGMDRFRLAGAASLGSGSAGLGADTGAGIEQPRRLEVVKCRKVGKHELVGAPNSGANGLIVVDDAIMVVGSGVSEGVANVVEVPSKFVVAVRICIHDGAFVTGEGDDPLTVVCNTTG